jgi:hypothetical protein
VLRADLELMGFGLINKPWRIGWQMILLLSGDESHF